MSGSIRLLKRRVAPVHLVLVLVTMVLAFGVFLVLPALIQARKAPRNTRFAPGYSEAKFNALRVAMSKQDVLALLGKPLSVRPDASGGELWRYTTSIDPDDSFIVNYVVFGPPGKVYAWESYTHYD